MHGLYQNMLARLFLGMICITPTCFAYAGTCAGDDLDLISDSQTFAFNSNVYLSAGYKAPSPSTYTIEISLSDYSDFIISALNGDALGELNFPVCFAATQGSAGNWASPYPGPTIPQAYIYFGGTPSNVNGNPTGNYLQMTGPTGDTTAMAAAVTYCKCGNYTPGQPEPQGNCNGTAPAVLLFIPQESLYALNGGGANGAIGNCGTSGDGGIFFTFYSEEGRIPPVGKYSLDLNNFVLGVKPAN